MKCSHHVFYIFVSFSNNLNCRTKFEQEEHIFLYDDEQTSCNFEHTLNYKTELTPQMPLAPIIKKQIYILKVAGAFADDLAITVRGESDSTVKAIMQQVLINAGKSAEQVDEYVLIEESTPVLGGEDHIEKRILPVNEPIMDAVACWNGTTRRFIMRKKGTDPSSRAWITSIIKSGTSGSASAASSPSSVPKEEHLKITSSINRHGRSFHSDTSAHQFHFDDSKDTNSLFAIKYHFSYSIDLGSRSLSMEDTFLLCVHNVSNDKPYVILRASVHCTAADIIRQVFQKSRRSNVDESDFVLIEETTDGLKSDVNSGAVLLNTGSGKSSRVLGTNENVWKAQCQWKNMGRFVLENRRETVHSTLDKVRAFILQLETAKQNTSN
ncbi:Ras association domain protein [Dictyocaulus viviparus]|uniref:Ras association domain protein n=1 Tax=Dictyocaulus viviparus TaxID=29172 RepID=A0A0D8XH46_DICVI|nr:Ras association domain protein [Dictyocaulus viviparus]